MRRRTIAFPVFALLLGAVAALAPGAHSAGQAPNHVSEDAPLQILGDNASDFLNSAAVGDFNADGTQDLLLGATGADGGGEDSG